LVSLALWEPGVGVDVLTVQDVIVFVGEGEVEVECEMEHLIDLKYELDFAFYILYLTYLCCVAEPHIGAEAVYGRCFVVGLEAT
jgi:hypothetical protein